MLLPVIALFILELALDKSLIESIRPSKPIESIDDIWLDLIKRSVSNFRKLFKIEQVLL